MTQTTHSQVRISTESDRRRAVSPIRCARCKPRHATRFGFSRPLTASAIVGLPLVASSPLNSEKHSHGGGSPAPLENVKLRCAETLC